MRRGETFYQMLQFRASAQKTVVQFTSASYLQESGTQPGEAVDLRAAWRARLVLAPGPKRPEPEWPEPGLIIEAGDVDMTRSRQA